MNNNNTKLTDNDTENISNLNGKENKLPEILPPVYEPPSNWEVPKTYIYVRPTEVAFFWLLVLTLVLMLVGAWLGIYWLGISSAVVSLLLVLRVLVPSGKEWINRFLTPDERINLLACAGLVMACTVIAKYLGLFRNLQNWFAGIDKDQFGSWAEWTGAVGQISIAVLAVYVAWQQYIISKDLTIQQNKITQQQTIDSYFQGVSDLALNGEGMLEDWPQERAIAEGRTAAIFSSVDAEGKAKILRFLSRSKLIVPLKRDERLGRAILDGYGNYAEDRPRGVRVINLGVMLAGADLSNQDLRWTDLSEANMVRINLMGADLVKANLSRTVLYDANLSGADLKGARLFYGSAETASPRSRTTPPDYETGAHTGAVVEGADFTGAKNLNEEDRYYCCAWGGEITRGTIPGGCHGIPNKLGR